MGRGVLWVEVCWLGRLGARVCIGGVTPFSVKCRNVGIYYLFNNIRNYSVNSGTTPKSKLCRVVSYGWGTCRRLGSWGERGGNWPGGLWGNLPDLVSLCSQTPSGLRRTSDSCPTQTLDSGPAELTS